MTIEGQSQQSYETPQDNKELQNEQTDILGQISEFFESNDLDTSIMKESYDSFSQSQKDFIIKAYQEMLKNPDLVMEIMELPYDEESFIFFQESLSLYIEIDINIEDNNIINDEQIENVYVEGIAKIEIQEEKIEIQEEKIEIQEEKIEIQEEKIEIQEEKLELEQVKLEQEKGEQEKIDKLYGDLYSNELYTSAFSKLGKNPSNEQKQDFFGNPDNIDKLLSLAKSTGNLEDVKELYSKLSSLNNIGDFGINLDEIESYLNENGVKTTDYKPIGITGEGSGGMMEDGVYSIGNEKIDYKENPPVKYLKSGRYELKSTELDTREIKQLRSEIFVLENELEQQKDFLSKNIDKTESLRTLGVNIYNMDSFNKTILNSITSLIGEGDNNSINELVTQYNETSAMGNDELSAELLKSSFEKLKSQVLEMIRKSINSVNKVKDKKEKNEIKLDLLKSELSNKEEQFTKNVIERDKEVEDTLERLNLIGFDQLPQSATDEIINTLNSDNAQRSMLGFDSEINLSEGNIGIHLDSDRNNISDEELKIFAKFMNILLTGDDRIPIETETVKLGQVPKYISSISSEGIKNSLGGNSNLNGFIKTSLGINPTEKVKSNVDNFLKKTN